MFVFRENWRGSFSSYLRFKIRTFALLPTKYEKENCYFQKARMQN